MSMPKIRPIHQDHFIALPPRSRKPLYAEPVSLPGSIAGRFWHREVDALAGGPAYGSSMRVFAERNIREMADYGGKKKQQRASCRRDEWPFFIHLLTTRPRATIRLPPSVGRASAPGLQRHSCSRRARLAGTLPGFALRSRAKTLI